MTTFDSIQKAVAAVLPEVDVLIGWEPGFDALHTTPKLVRVEEDAESLVWNKLCVSNLATQLQYWRGKKVGLIVKGCDSRSVVQLMQENIFDRESLVIIGVPCTGVVDLHKIKLSFGVVAADEVTIEGDTLSVAAGDKTMSMQLDDALADKCKACRYPNPVVYDHLVGEPVEPWNEEFVPSPRLQELLAKTEDERNAYWQDQMSRCVRCYACRNSCPMCICRDHCIAESREPHWQSQETSVREKWMFQMIHAMHLAGRCTGCGECERACPVNIPVLLFKQQLGTAIHDIFNYEAGIDPEAVPPLQTFKVEEDAIEEREL